MDALADRLGGRDVGSIFLYTNEAHPGENFPHHTSMEQKFQHAGALAKDYGVRRPIFVDALSGDAHWAYGSMPNMTWIFNRAGLVLYKSDWSDSKSVSNAVDYYLEVQERRKAKERLSPFKVERLDYHNTDRDSFTAGLERSGPKAVTEFRDAFK